MSATGRFQSSGAGKVGPAEAGQFERAPMDPAAGTARRTHGAAGHVENAHNARMFPIAAPQRFSRRPLREFAVLFRQPCPIPYRLAWSGRREWLVPLAPPVLTSAQQFLTSPLSQLAAGRWGSSYVAIPRGRKGFTAGGALLLLSLANR